jgi:aminoglycoside 6'-N-acetyltransferase
VPAVTFIRVTEEHRDLLRSWLSSPHAQEWWDEPEEEIALIYDGKGEHEPYIACVNGEPIAYIQSWWPSRHSGLTWQNDMPASTRGIDVTIGDPINLGKGLGSLIVRHFAAKLFAEGAKRLVIDPGIQNNRAISAYLKAGFTPYGTWEHGDGTDLLMEMLPEDFDYGFGHAET